MPVMLVCDPERRETEILNSVFVDYAAANLPDDWQFVSEASARTVLEKLRNYGDVQLYCADVTAGGMEALAPLREASAAILAVVIAETSTSPLLYMRPDVMASGILLRPFSPDQIRHTISEVFEAIRLREREALFQNDMFTAGTKGELIRVPYAKILYFEARAKKVFLCTGSDEIGFYDSLDSLMGRLPAYFTRCHKGFIANMLLVEKASLSENTLTMFGGFSIPISRSCKAAVKEALL